MNTHPAIIHPQAHLTNKQQRFCEEYVVNWNATQAAIEAGYSEKTAQVIGSENLSKPMVKEYIEDIQKDLSKLCGVSAASNINTMLEIRDNNKEKAIDRIRSVEVINKMLGFNASEKHDHTTDGRSIDLINWVK